ncbi:hypothetical protein ACFQWF_01320 [Methylorubrum suomiense]
MVQLPHRHPLPGAQRRGRRRTLAPAGLNHRGYKPDNWYVGEGLGQIAASGSTVSVGKMYLYSFFITRAILISELGFRTAATVAGNTEVAIYAGRAPYGRPSALIGCIGPLANAVQGTNYTGAIVGGNKVMEPGFYYGASQADAVTTYVAVNSSNNTAPSSQLGSASVGGVLNPSQGITGFEFANTYNADPTQTFPPDLTNIALTETLANRAALVAFKIPAAA